MHPITAKQLLDSAPRRQAPPQYRNTVWRWIGAGLRRWQQHRMTVALHKLDDRMLADVGLDRSDISRMVKQLSARELQMVPVAEPASEDSDPPGKLPLAA